jgi:hypothetical protein
MEIRVEVKMGSSNAKCEAFEVLGSWMSRLTMWQLGLGEKIFVAEDDSQSDDNKIRVEVKMG